MATAVERVAYAAGQAARVGWYMGQYLLANRISPPDLPKADMPEGTGFPATAEILADLRELLRRDWRNIDDGLYRLPHDLVQDPRRLLADAARFLRDVPEVARRRKEQANAEVFREPPAGTEKLPRYYRQNFHYQTDGYLSDRSARLYDHQVEVLFGGGADAMRRQALVPIARYLRGRPVRQMRLLDVASGTGRFLTFVKDNYPKLDVTALDLSQPYLAEARRNLSPWSGVNAVLAPAEKLPFADASQDVVTCIYLFHELPAKVRAQAAAEFARVLKPGGLVVLVDSLQLGDKPRFDGLLRLFPVAFHEPYYAQYIAADLQGLFTGAGLEPDGTENAFLSKVMAFRKPGAP